MQSGNGISPDKVSDFCHAATAPQGQAHQRHPRGSGLGLALAGEILLALRRKRGRESAKDQSPHRNQSAFRHYEHAGELPS